MPIYTYKCNDCKKEFIINHSMTIEWDYCPKCGSDNIKRVIKYSPPVIFKGEGFTKERV